MNKIEKVKQWIKDNDYKIDSHYDSQNEICYSWCYKLEGILIATQCILINEKTGNIRVGITLPFWYYDERQDLENLFIPLNNVKQDEKSLKEYLKNVEN